MRSLMKFSAMVIVALAVGSLSGAAKAADPKPAGKPADKDQATAKEEAPSAPLRAGDKKPEVPTNPHAKKGGKGAKGHGRLPRFYAEIVSEKQVQTIFEIQDQFDKSIAKLEADIARLRRERDEKVTNVLTAEQKQKLRRLTEEAKRPPEKPTEDRPTATPRSEPRRD